MQWFNLHIPVIRSPEFAGAESWEVGVWLKLVTYCCEQENGGQILGCAEWTDRQWMLSVGVSLSELKKDSQLWTWAVANPGVLWVHAYPEDQQARMEHMRNGGKKGGKSKSEAKTAASKANGSSGGRPAKPYNLHITQCKVREGNVIPLQPCPELEPEPGQEMR